MIQQFNGHEVGGRALNINEAKPREDRGGIVVVSAAVAMAAAVRVTNSAAGYFRRLFTESLGTSIRLDAFSCGQRLLNNGELTTGEHQLSKERLGSGEGLVVDKLPNASSESG